MSVGFLLGSFVGGILTCYTTWRMLFVVTIPGAGVAFCQSPPVRTCISSVQKEVFGLASGMIETMRLIGIAISIAITIIVFTVVIGNTHITTPLVPLFIQSFHIIFWIFSGISLCGLLAALTLKRERPVQLQ